MGSLNIYIRSVIVASRCKYPDWSIIIVRCKFRVELRLSATNLSKTFYNSSRYIFHAKGISTYEPGMTITSITRRLSPPAFKAVSWVITANTECS